MDLVVVVEETVVEEAVAEAMEAEGFECAEDTGNLLMCFVLLNGSL